MSSSSTSQSSSHCYQLEKPVVAVVGLNLAKELEQYQCSIDSQIQSHGRYLPYEIEDDMAASAASLEVSNSIGLRSHPTHSMMTTEQKKRGKPPKHSSKENSPSPLSTSAQRSDKHTPLLFKRRARPKCAIMIQGSSRVLQE